MPLRKVALVENEFYHIFNRGNSKQTIFHNNSDYERFINLLFISNGSENFKFQFIGKKNIYEEKRGKPLVGIGAYCLMPNHFHILLIQPKRGNISKFMQKVSTGYSMYFNNKYKHTGSLFEGKFKAEHATSDPYLKYLFSYIHLNPVKLIDKDWKKNGIKNISNVNSFLNNYKYSSYLDYQKQNRPQKQLLNIELFPDYFQSPKIFREEIFDWLSYRQDL